MDTSTSLYHHYWYWPGSSLLGRAAHGVTAVWPAAWFLWGCYKWVADGVMVEPRRYWGRPWAQEQNQWEYVGVFPKPGTNSGRYSGRLGPPKTSRWEYWGVPRPLGRVIVVLGCHSHHWNNSKGVLGHPPAPEPNQRDSACGHVHSLKI